MQTFFEMREGKGETEDGLPPRLILTTGKLNAGADGGRRADVKDRLLKDPHHDAKARAGSLLEQGLISREEYEHIIAVQRRRARPEEDEGLSPDLMVPGEGARRQRSLSDATRTVRQRLNSFTAEARNVFTVNVPDLASMKLDLGSRSMKALRAARNSVIGVKIERLKRCPYEFALVLAKQARPRRVRTLLQVLDDADLQTFFFRVDGPWSNRSRRARCLPCCATFAGEVILVTATEERFRDASLKKKARRFRYGSVVDTSSETTKRAKLNRRQRDECLEDILRNEVAMGRAFKDVVMRVVNLQDQDIISDVMQEVDNWNIYEDFPSFLSIAAIDRVREEFGDAAGWYLAFLRHFTLCLVPLAFIGVLTTLDLNADVGSWNAIVVDGGKVEGAVSTPQTYPTIFISLVTQVVPAIMLPLPPSFYLISSPLLSSQVWAAIALRTWLRREAWWQVRWNQRGVQEYEDMVVRSQFIGHRKKIIRRINGLRASITRSNGNEDAVNASRISGLAAAGRRGGDIGGGKAATGHRRGSDSNESEFRHGAGYEAYEYLSDSLSSLSGSEDLHQERVELTRPRPQPQLDFLEPQVQLKQRTKRGSSSGSRIRRSIDNALSFFSPRHSVGSLPTSPTTSRRSPHLNFDAGLERRMLAQQPLSHIKARHALSLTPSLPLFLFVFASYIIHLPSYIVHHLAGPRRLGHVCLALRPEDLLTLYSLLPRSPRHIHHCWLRLAAGTVVHRVS